MRAERQHRQSSEAADAIFEAEREIPQRIRWRHSADRETTSGVLIMNRPTIAAIAGLGLISMAGTAWSKGAIIKIVIDGSDLPTPIELTDPQILERFTIWSGPGVRGWDMINTMPNAGDATFIIDWPKGLIKDRPDGLRRYDVSMHIADREAPRNRYEVIYEIDSTTDKGYIYLPRSNENLGRWNTFLIYRKVEGNWFHSSKDWEEVVRPLVGE